MIATENFKFSEVPMKSELLKAHVGVLLNAGYRVFVYAKEGNKSFCKVVRGDQIASVEAYYFGGLNFGTVHKPNKETGTGFSMNREVFTGLDTTAYLDDCFRLAPNWASAKQRKSVVKYASWAEYTQKSSLKYVEVLAD